MTMYTHNLNPPVNIHLCPSRIFGGPTARFVPNIVLPALPPGTLDDPDVWRPIDHLVGNAALGPFYVAPHVARAVYVSRDVRFVRVLVLAWDTPDMIAVYGAAAGWPLGWQESRRLTPEMLTMLQQKAAELLAGAGPPARDGGAAAGQGGVDEWKAAEIEAKVRAVEQAWRDASQI
jgi:hypothetical protein